MRGWIGVDLDGTLAKSVKTENGEEIGVVTYTYENAGNTTSKTDSSKPLSYGRSNIIELYAGLPAVRAISRPGTTSICNFGSAAGT
jgi:hypothetical protein